MDETQANTLEIYDDDLLQKLKDARSGVGYEGLVLALTRTQRERDAERNQTPVERRRSTVRKEIRDNELEDADRHHIHSVLALCGLPYRRPQDEQGDFIREYGRNSLVVQPGYLKDPETGKMVRQGLPYGPKARLLLLHICTMAIRQRNPKIEIADSMTAFIRDLGFPVTGGSRGTLTQFKEQLNRLAASRLQIGVWRGDKTSTINTSPIEAFDIWLPSDPSQKMLWNSSLLLDKRFYDSLRQHALPVDIRTLRAFSQSAKQIDMVLWLAYRLKTVKRRYVISWSALQEQFGADVGRARRFRESFVADLEAIREVLPNLPFEISEEGLCLTTSTPDQLLVRPKGVFLS